VARPSKLTENEIEAELKELEGWQIRDGKLNKTFKFTDFIDAWGFMCRVALAAQAMDHHPEWLNVYNTVRVDLSTHDAGGVTKLDLQLARKMNLYA
jgi:4a-hydroxytetrahydrobiopterin dehydratase